MSEKKLDKKIIDIFREKEKVNIGYIVAGYPSVDFTKQFLQNLDNTALDMLEVGIPYSDPLADGKWISHASFLASEAGVTTDTVFDLLAEIKNNISKPLIFLIYYNLIFAYGIDKFIKKCCEANVKGMIIPDLPRLESFINEIREVSDLPVSLGFGIKNNDNVNTMRKYADGVIVGTSIVEFLEKNDVNYLIQKINELFK